jgi:hypothetical protein
VAASRNNVTVFIPMRRLTADGMPPTFGGEPENGSTTQAKDMSEPHPDEIGGRVLCRKCGHRGQYLTADVRNAEAERRLRDRLA